MKKPSIIFLMLFFVISIGFANTNEIVQRKIVREGNKTTIPISKEKNWTKISFELKGENKGNSHIIFQGTNSKLNVFKGIRDHLRIRSAKENYKGFQMEPRITYPAKSKKWHRVVVSSSGGWRGGVRVFEVGSGEEVLPKSGERIEDRFLFHVFEDREGGFVPDEVMLVSNKPGEKAVFRNISITYQEDDIGGRDFEPAPEDSVVAVEPDWEKVLAASVTGAEMKVGKEIKIGEGFEEVYRLGDVELNVSSTEIRVEDLKQLYFPEKNRYVLAEGNRKEKLGKALTALEENVPLVYKNISGTEVKHSDERTVSNHIVLADVSKPCSALAPLYADRKDGNLIPVDSSRESKKEIHGKLVEKYRNMSKPLNHEAVVKGVFLTNFGAEMKEAVDPIEKSEKILYSDEIDGEKFYTERTYTDLDNDSFVDVNYGRIPENVEKAYKMLETDFEGGGSVVASEYLYPTWVQIVAHLGGGVTQGLKTKTSFENQGKTTLLLVENRTSYEELGGGIRGVLSALLGLPDPVAQIKNRAGIVKQLKNGEFRKTLSYLLQHPEKIAKAWKEKQGEESEGSKVEETSNKKLRKTLSNIGKFKDAVTLIKAGLEYRFEHRPEKLSELKSRELEDLSYTEIERTVLKSFLKHRKPVNKENLARMYNYSKAVYIGRGNGTHWLLPNSEGSLVDRDLKGFNQYNGTNRFRPDGYRGLLIDSSSTTASPRSFIKRKVLENGSEGFLGSTAKTYPHYIQEVVQRFIKRGFEKGTAYRKALNLYREDSWTFDPHNAFFFNAYWRAKARKNKTLMSTTFYGVPDEEKDPEKTVSRKPERKCEKGRCVFSWNIKPDLEMEGGEILVGDVMSSEQSGMPTVYYTKISRSLPSGSKVLGVDVEREESKANFSYVNSSVEKFPLKPREVDVRSVTGGMKKAVIKIPVLKAENGDTWVSEQVQVNLTTIQDVSADLGKDGNNLEARIDSEKGFEAKISLIISNKTWEKEFLKEVEIEEGSNSYRWSFPDIEGRYTAELYVSGNVSLGPHRKKVFFRKEKSRMKVETPETARVGEKFFLTAETMNSENQEIRLETSKGLQTCFLEDKVFREGEEICLRGFKKGVLSGKLASGNLSKNLTVEIKERNSFSKVLSAVKSVFTEDYRFGNFKAEIDSGKLVLETENQKGRLRFVKTPSKTVKKLEMPGKMVKTVRNSEKQIEKLETPEGFFRKVLKDGRIRVSNEKVKESDFENAVSDLRKESRKLIERFHIKRPGLNRW